MKKLTDLLNNIPRIQTLGDDHLEVSGVVSDSRLVSEGDLFVAVSGLQVDGHRYIDQAIDRGARAIVYEKQPDDTRVGTSVTGIRVSNTSEVLGQLASAWYDHPSKALKVVGITGTNGKTTVSTLLHELFTRLGHSSGLIGTIENRVGQTVVSSTHTTPDATALQQLLHQMVVAGCTHAFMETSSHALVQHRTAGVTFSGAVFTNLTHDHLDYHGTFAAYRDAKKLLFDGLSDTAFALVNADDRNSMFMLQNSRASKHTFGLKKPAGFKGKVLENALTGLHMLIDDQQVHTRMVGAFNAYNLLAAYGVARLLGTEQQEALTALSALNGAEGRFERVPHPALKNTIGVIDYAHTPDALEKVLETIVAMKPKEGRVLTLVGCGGDRDRGKRPVMAQLAVRMSDLVILTSDNPRNEEPAAIIADMEAGLNADQKKNILIIENREQAIRAAGKMLQQGDVLLVAGKGHEKYQEIKGEKFPFDDKAILQDAMGIPLASGKT